MIDALIGGAASIAGGLINANSQKKTNEALMKDKQMDRDMQWSLANSGIQMKVSDAKQAGIHPLYALGASTPTYTPSSLSLTAPSPGSGLAAAGQNIGRALNATMNQGDRVDAFTKASQALMLEKGSLENQLLRSQINQANQAGNPPPMPIGQRYLIEGQGNAPGGSNLVKEKPMERTPGAPGQMHQEPGAITDVGYVRTKSGGFLPVPSKDVKERIEDMSVYELTHMLRNYILPTFGINRSPPPAPLPKDSPGWVYDPIRGYRPGKNVPGTFGLFRY